MFKNIAYVLCHYRCVTRLRMLQRMRLSGGVAEGSDAGGAAADGSAGDGGADGDSVDDVLSNNFDIDLDNLGDDDDVQPLASWSSGLKNV